MFRDPMPTLRVAMRCPFRRTLKADAEQGHCETENQRNQQGLEEEAAYTWVKNVLLVKIEGPVWYTIYHHLPILLKGFVTPLY